jgi:hypothetical protein
MKLSFNIIFHLQTDGQTKRVPWDVKPILEKLCDCRSKKLGQTFRLGIVLL